MHDVLKMRIKWKMQHFISSSGYNKLQWKYSYHHLSSDKTKYPWPLLSDKSVLICHFKRVLSHAFYLVSQLSCVFKSFVFIWDPFYCLNLMRKYKFAGSCLKFLPNTIWCWCVFHRKSDKALSKSEVKAGFIYFETLK